MRITQGIDQLLPCEDELWDEKRRSEGFQYTWTRCSSANVFFCISHFLLLLPFSSAFWFLFSFIFLHLQLGLVMIIFLPSVFPFYCCCYHCCSCYCLSSLSHSFLPPSLATFSQEKHSRPARFNHDLHLFLLLLLLLLLVLLWLVTSPLSAPSCCCGC